MNQLFHTNGFISNTFHFNANFRAISILIKSEEEEKQKYGKAGKATEPRQKHIGVNINFGHTTITSINLPFKFKKNHNLHGILE